MFTNPIQTQTSAGASAPVVTPSQSAEIAIGGVSSLLGFFENYQKVEAQRAQTNQPEAWVVKEEWETEGHKQAAALAATYRQKRETDGVVRAEQWLDKQTLTISASLGKTGADSFMSSLDKLIGKNAFVEERAQEQARAATYQQKLDELKLAGRELFAAKATTLGVSPDAIDDDTAIGLAMVYNGQKAATALEQAQNAVTIQNQGMIDRDRKLTSQAAVVQASSDLTANLRVTTMALSKGITANPNEAPQLKARAVMQLQQQKAQIQNQVAAAINAAGGNIADVDNTLLNGLVNQYDAVINTLNGTDEVKVLQNHLDTLSLGTTINAIDKLPTQTKQFLMVNSSMRSPVGFTDKQLQNLPASQYNPNQLAEVIANLGDLGAAGARQNTGVPVSRSYGLVTDAIRYAVDKVEARAEAAGMFVNTMMNSFNAGSSVRREANSANGLPVLLNDLSRNPKAVELGVEIEEAARAEGSSTEEMFTRSLTTMFRESVYPSLSITDPYVVPNLNIDFDGGKFKVTLNEDSYRTQSGLKRNVMPHSGRDLSDEQVSALNRRLRQVESVLNTSLLSYKNIGGNPADLGAALKYQLDVAAGITKARAAVEQAEVPVTE